MKNQNEVATKEDIKKLQKQIKGCATKDDLRAFATKDDLDNYQEKTENKITAFKDQILTAIDSVMGELKTIREESDAHAFSHSRTNDTLLDHETRITKLENSPLQP